MLFSNSTTYIHVYGKICTNLDELLFLSFNRLSQGDHQTLLTCHLIKVCHSTYSASIIWWLFITHNSHCQTVAPYATSLQEELNLSHTLYVWTTEHVYHINTGWLFHVRIKCEKCSLYRTPWVRPTGEPQVIWTFLVLWYSATFNQFSNHWILIIHNGR